MYQVILFYKYVNVEDPQELADRFRVLMKKYELLGRVIVAEEGVNATIEGRIKNTEKFVEELFEDHRLSDIVIKRSAGEGKSFPKCSVKVRDEIVSTKFDKREVNPRVKTAPKITSEELRSWYEQEKDFVVVDMRNDYEFQSGHFKNSLNPALNASRDLSEVLPKLEGLKNKTVLTVCTGGIRCEKMSAFLQVRGFGKVYQLENGIHSYMEKYPGKDFLGTLYTFDNRLVMDFGGEREIIGICRSCSKKTENYVNCANNECHLHFLLCEECMRNDKKMCSKKCEEILAEQVSGIIKKVS